MKQEEFDRQIECAAKCDSKTAVTAAMSLAYHHPGLAMNWYEKNGQKGQASSDGGLTEFEKAVEHLMGQVQCGKLVNLTVTTKEQSKELLSIARKQIVSEIDVDSIEKAAVKTVCIVNKTSVESDDFKLVKSWFMAGVKEVLKAIKGE